MREIGGYFEMESMHASEYHKGAIALNSCRNAIRYVIRTYKIQEMYVPFYTCPVVWDAIDTENCKIIPYDIDSNFMPKIIFPNNAFILYNNYFGICGKNVSELSKKYKNIIIDNAQAFYAPKSGIASVYSPRKFFGVPDGGLVLCDNRLYEELETSVSYDKCLHLLKRVDLGANAGYTDFQSNDEALIGQSIQKMSKLTALMMGNINYDFAKQQRLKNFAFLHKDLSAQNEIHIDLNDTDIPMVYPFKTKDTELRTKLISNKIFTAKYWPSENNNCMKSDISQELVNTIIPLPIDQRYSLKDMDIIINNIRSKK